MSWGADTYELDRALSLARYSGNRAEVERLERELATARAACNPHDPNPEHPLRCWRCGASLGPTVHSATASPASAKRSA